MFCLFVVVATAALVLFSNVPPPNQFESLNILSRSSTFNLRLWPVLATLRDNRGNSQESRLAGRLLRGNVTGVTFSSRQPTFPLVFVSSRFTIVEGPLIVYVDLKVLHSAFLIYYYSKFYWSAWSCCSTSWAIKNFKILCFSPGRSWPDSNRNNRHSQSRYVTWT